MLSIDSPRCRHSLSRCSPDGSYKTTALFSFLHPAGIPPPPPAWACPHVGCLAQSFAKPWDQHSRVLQTY